MWGRFRSDCRFHGYIITNAHVIEGAQHIRVVLPTPSVESPLEIPSVSKQQVLDAKPDRNEIKRLIWLS